MADVYADGAHQGIADTRWIADADRHDWIVLTKDERITRRADEQQALIDSRLRVFAIGNQHLTGPQQASYYVANIHRIVQRSRTPGPFVDIVHPYRVERRWPR